MASSERPSTLPTGDEKVLGALSYLWVLSVVILLVKRDSEFVRFHAKQGLVLFLAFTLFSLLAGFGWVLNAFVIAIVLFGFYQAWNGAMWRMPVIGDIAEKIRL